MIDMTSKIKAVMIGHAVGDALGVPVEFCKREQRKKQPVTDMMGYGTYPVPAGAWSDDTSMSIAALDSFAGGCLDFDGIMDNFIMWLSQDEYTPTGETFDVGHTCLCAIRNRMKNKDLPATQCGQGGEYANGNGSLMRIHPFVLYAYFVMPHETGDDHSLWMTLIRYASLLTHAHDRSVMACYIYGYILTSLLKEPTRESLAAGIQFAGEDLNHLHEFEHYARLFAPDFAALPEEEIKSSGYVVDTLEAAVWCLLTTDSYRDCVLKAVNLGGDTDTVAAVAGGLAGALYGYEGIPQAWRETLIKREWIEEMCERAGSEWGAERSQK